MVEITVGYGALVDVVAAAAAGALVLRVAV